MFQRLFGKKVSPEEELVNIVSGLPRSGTSMMMKMLTAGGIPPLTDHLREPDKDNPRGYYEFERVKKLREGDHAWLPEAQGKVVKVIATLLPYLPSAYQYRVVFMERAMPEILASQRQMLIRRGEDPDRVSDETIQSLFEKHLVQVDSWMAGQDHLQSIRINYNHLMADPEPALRTLNEFFGGSLDVKAMADCIDPALYRQRKSDE
jgi:hypothetical protein